MDKVYVQGSSESQREEERNRDRRRGDASPRLSSGRGCTASPVWDSCVLGWQAAGPPTPPLLVLQAVLLLPDAVMLCHLFLILYVDHIPHPHQVTPLT